MPFKINRIPGLAWFCIGTLLGLLLTYLIVVPGVSERLAKAQEEYGQTLSSMTGRRVIDAFFNNDLVRLQAVLQDLVTRPHIVQATIHDIENNLLVQAGEGRPAVDSHTPYSASIVIHDSISGYVTLTMKNFDRSLVAAVKSLWTLSVILAMVLAFSLYHARSFEWIKTEKEKAPEEKATSEEASSENDTTETESTETRGLETEASEPTAPAEPDESLMVYAIIHIKNLDVLKQQLTAEVKRVTFEKLENIIGDVLALYGGREYTAEQNYYILKFHAIDAQNEAIFRALCSAFLIVELASIINKVPLDLAAFVSANKEDLIPAKLPVAGLVIESHAAKDELIQRRLKFMEVGTEDGRSIVANFEQPFCNLLENQRKHLSALTSTSG